MSKFNWQNTQTERRMACNFSSWMDLAGHLKKPEAKVDMVPGLDLLVIALLVSLLFTRFVMFPGIHVDLPTTEFRVQHPVAGVSVLTMENRGMLFFEGNVYEMNTIERAFRKQVENGGLNDPVLLVKPQADMSLEMFLSLCHMAQEAGFIRVQIAGKKKETLTETAELKGLENKSLEDRLAL